MADFISLLLVWAVAYLGYKAWTWMTTVSPNSRYHEYRLRLKVEQERHARELAEPYWFEDSTLTRHSDRTVSEGRWIVPDWFGELLLIEQLHRYYHKKVKLNPEQVRHAKELVSIFIGAIVDSVKDNIDERKPTKAKPCRIECTGSMYEGTKWGQPDEFDIMIVIDGSQDIGSEEVTPGYSRLFAHDSTHRFSKCTDDYNDIFPTKMIDWFYGRVQKGINQVKKADWDSAWPSISRHGPAVQVNIEEKNGNVISVDLVLCIQLGPQGYFVAKPFKEYADDPPDWRLTYDPSMLWRQSFSVRETRTISRVDGAKECRRLSLRILKSIFRKEPGLDKFTSYHLKTVLLHECRSQGSWQISNIDERLMDLLGRIESCLREESLPHFYLPELNLLDGIRHVTIENMRGRVQRLINSKSERDRVLYA